MCEDFITVHGLTKRVFEFLICKYLIWQEACLFDTYLRRWYKNSSHQATEKFKGLLYQSVGAVITKCHWLYGLERKFIHSSGGSKSEMRVGFCWGLSFWLADAYLLPVAWYGRARERAFSCCSVAKSCTTLRDPVDCCLPGFPVPHHLLEFAQFHVHWVGDAIPAFSCLFLKGQ